MAMENRWEEAVSINRSVIELFPDDVEARNRLGKALFELGRYREARAAFAKALELSPSNTIARKNLERLSILKREEKPLKKAPKMGPEHFLEESGKTGIVVLEQPASKEVLAKVTAGDAVTLRIGDNTLVAETMDGKYLGHVPPRTAARVIRLTHGGNQYEAAVTRLGGNQITIIVREVFQHPSLYGITSFPTRGEQLHPYPQTPLMELDLLEEEEDEEIEAAFNSEWEESGEPTDLLPRPSFNRQPDAEEESEEGS